MENSEQPGDPPPVLREQKKTPPLWGLIPPPLPRPKILRPGWDHPEQDSRRGSRVQSPALCPATLQFSQTPSSVGTTHPITGGLKLSAGKGQARM